MLSWVLGSKASLPSLKTEEELAAERGPRTTVPQLDPAKATVPPPPEGYPLHGLKSERVDAARRLLAHVEKSVLHRPSGPDDAAGAAQRAREAAWADLACCVRYLRATRWNYDLAAKRLEATLNWRREYKPDEISDEEVQPEAECGKEVISVYLVPARENTKTYDRQLRFVVYNLEKLVKLMPPGIESLCIVVDYENISVATAPPLSVTRRFLQVVGDHYPERLGTSFVINPSWYLWVLFRVVGPFLDPVTRSKIHMVNLKNLLAEDAGDDSSSSSRQTLPRSAPRADESHETAADPTETAVLAAATAAAAAEEPQGKQVDGTGGWTDIRKYIDPEQLLSDYGGKYPFDWKFEDYWPIITKV
ncbi:hypothetical protein HK105_201867 [Polyrhizophydium stewartii]|uniref:CRAL-TRIO domain-containing protein n=1 Tax=Polyrhizophydium stewartii TaxID=2732419 RepID=A0ABR4NG91_9FUNG|nr:hypothetical protein HK105_004982 [Polyrhizophydium stewartii]